MDAGRRRQDSLLGSFLEDIYNRFGAVPVQFQLGQGAQEAWIGLRHKHEGDLC